ncbi:DUF3857 domain-containing protein [Mesonia sp. K7]|uniref:DUF3857 domain-containing protein n=1 Tax=Mesonia sp. K7 TaxID=2218606 RepID=UPI000DA8BCB5|nr:DUF3857 domain-containing protein [Mesonia sp. K7]PZD77707.1 hypothetical protein DNG35_07675 [Mesonia sp. K7]
MKRNLLFILSILLTQISFSQDLKYGKISEEILKQDQSLIDATADAEIIDFEKKIYFELTGNELMLVTEVHKRIKFYNTSDDALSHASHEVYLYKGETEKEKIHHLKGATYNLSGDKIVKDKLENSQVFETNHNEFNDVVKFTMPNVQDGSVVEYSYHIRSPFFFNIEELRYQDDIPIRDFYAEVKIPTYMQFNRLPKGFVFPNVKEEKDIFDNKANNKVNKYEYSISNVPAIKSEKWVDNIDNYIAGTLFEIVAVSYANGDVKVYSLNWNDVAKTLTEHEDYKNGLTKDASYRDELTTYLQGTTDPIEKMHKVLRFTKEHISWNNRYGKYFENGIRKAFKEKTGNVADVNLSLVSMLRHAGLEAVPIVLTTRDFMRPIIPTITHLNYVVAYVKIDDKDFLLDATDIYSEPNILPRRAYNYFGLVVDPYQNLWNQINLQSPRMAIGIKLVNLEFDFSDKSVFGSFKEMKKNHYAYYAKRQYYNSSEEEYISEKEKQWEDLVIEEYDMNDEESQRVQEDFNYKKSNAYSLIGDEILFNPLIFGRYKTTPFKADERNYPVDFFAPYQDKMVLNIKVPEGYKVKSLPESKHITFGSNIGDFKYLITESNGFIRVSLEETMKNNRVFKEDYKSLKEYFDKIVELQSKQIVLEKV